MPIITNETREDKLKGDFAFLIIETWQEGKIELMQMLELLDRLKTLIHKEDKN